MLPPKERNPEFLNPKVDTRKNPNVQGGLNRAGFENLGKKPALPTNPVSGICHRKQFFD